MLGLSRRRAELPCTVARSAYQTAGSRAGRFALALRHHAGDDGCVIAVDLLQQAAADEAHTVCPYSKATKGNIPVKVTVV